MELRHLHCFITVAEELNFRKAAERLNISQPALSARIKDLEDKLTTRLFDRDTGGVRLTNAGRMFMGEAREVLQRADHAVASMQDSVKGRSGKLVVGYVSAAAADFLPPALRVFAKRFPKVEIVLLEMLQQEQIDAVRAHEADVGFAIGSGQNAIEHMREFPLFRSPLKVLVGAQHRLASRARVSLSEIVDESLLCFSPLMVRQLEKIFGDRGLALAPPKILRGVGAIAGTLSSGQGVTLFAEFMHGDRLKNVRSLDIRDKGEDLKLTVRAFCRKDDKRPDVRDFIAVVAEFCRQKGLGAPSFGR